MYISLQFLLDFNETWTLLTDFFFSENTEISNFMEIRPVGAEMFRADGRTDGQTDMTKLIDAFRNSAKSV